MPVPLDAQAPAAAPKDALAPLDRFLGTWAGPGTLQGAQARLELRFERALGNRFLRIQHQNRVETPRGEMLFEGLSIYRARDGGFAATWYDSFGHVYPVEATLDGDALRAEWGTPETEQGTTVYRLTAPGTLVERMRDQLAIDDAEHGAAEPDDTRRAAIGSAGALEQRARGLVVQEDQAVRVADEHAARELGHERGEPLLLLVEPRVRVLDARFHGAERRLLALGEVVDDTGECRRLGRTLLGQPMRRVGADDDARTLGCPHHAGDVRVESARDAESDHHEQERREHQQQAGGVFDHGTKRLPEIVRDARPEHESRRDHDARDGGERERDCGSELCAQARGRRSGWHRCGTGHAPSIRFTSATSSRWSGPTAVAALWSPAKKRAMRSPVSLPSRRACSSVSRKNAWPRWAIS